MAEAELADGEVVAQLALTGADIGVWDWDVRSGRLRWDRRVAEIHGIDLDTFDGRMETFLSRVHPDDVAEALASIQAALVHGGPFLTEFRVHRLDGTTGWVQGRGRAILDDLGEPVRVVGVGLDTTELRVARERAARALDHINDGLIVLDSSWRFAYLNHRAGLLLDQRGRNLVGTGFWEFFADAVGGDAWRRYHDAMANQEATVFEIWSTVLNGWYEVRAFPAPDVLTIIFRNTDVEHRATEDRTALLDELRASLARERDVAETLARAILPDRLPTVEGLVLGAHYQPATGLDIGGDWYDAFALPSGELAIVVGDVAGHGVPAAAVMGQLRHALRAYAETNLGPADVLHRLDALLLGAEQDVYATVVFALVDPQARTVRWSSAGHPPMLLVPVEGEPSFLGGEPEPLLGIGMGPHTDHLAMMRPGDLLLAVTDGLIERRSEGLGTGMERLAAAAGSLRHLEPEALCPRLIDVLEPTPDDDLCVLALRLAPDPHG